jgi:hypothetical protein
MNIAPAQTVSPAPPPAGAKESHVLSGHGGFSFRDLLDVVNPLQHIPVIGTIYRAISGEKIGTLERIAGDALYGGVWGAISAAADSAFEAVTGRDFGSTMLALFGGGKDEAPKARLANATTPPPATPPPATDVAALSNALLARGVDDDLARRAMFAYKKSMELPALALTNG